MYNIMVLGGGRAASRFIESLLFTKHNLAVCGFGVKNLSERLAMKYSLPFHSFSTLTSADVAKIDVVILATPPADRLPIIKHLVYGLNFTGALVIEKPLCICLDELYQVVSLTSYFDKCAVVCQRDFAIEYYRFLTSDVCEYNIVWNTPFNEHYENVIHMFPHLASWILCLTTEKLTFHNGKRNHLVGYLGNVRLNVAFSSKTKDKGVYVNGCLYQPPNFRLINAKIIERIMLFTKEQSHDSIGRALKVSEMTIKLLNAHTNK